MILEYKYLNGKIENVKEYNNSFRLIYEGEYLKGRRNGKGKEYDEEERLIFEGEFLNGKRWKGKEYKYNFSGILTLECEKLNGERNGKGKEYDRYGSLIFEGEYLYNYKRRGKAYVKDYLEFEGEYLFDRKWNGKGYDENGNVIYELINGNGRVREYNDDQVLIYEGDYSDGKRNGKGKEFEYGKIIFEGNFLEGKRYYDKNKK